MTAFVDTHALIAWLSRRDRWHSKAAECFAQYRGTFVTTEWILLELADSLSQPIHRRGVVRLLHAIRSRPSFEIVGYDATIFRAGFDLFSNRPDKGWSLTDCISFAVMADRGLSDALTADHHFEQAGFHAMLK